jgi:hypothetical protein
MKSVAQIRTQIASLRRQLREAKQSDGRFQPKKHRNRDEEAKQRLGYTDPKSYVRLDGSEVLYNADWKKRKEELRERSFGRCERIVEIRGNSAGEIRCRSEARDPDHVVKRSIRRDDRLTNLEHLCGLHHDLKHPEFKPRWTKHQETLADA